MCSRNGEKRIYTNNRKCSGKLFFKCLAARLLFVNLPKPFFSAFPLFFFFVIMYMGFVNAQPLPENGQLWGIHLNQIGFGTKDQKIAVLNGQLFPGQHQVPFYLIALNQFSDTVLKGRLQPTGPGRYDHRQHFIADFSNYTKKGHYYLAIPGQGNSYPFYIQDQPFETILKATVKALYFDRASTETPKQYAGLWARKAGHPDSAVWIHTSVHVADKKNRQTISASGGWYSGGGYNKNIVTASITMNTLLMAFNQYPDQFTHLALNIPSSDNTLPDLLNELLYNLRWMFTMQDPTDGGVYHKLTSEKPAAVKMPAKDHHKRYVVQKSTAATLDFASVMATASNTLSPYADQLPGLMDSLNRAALTAWAWAVKHPEIIYDQKVMNKRYRPRISTPGYDDKDLSDEWFQAAVSLLLMTRDPIFLSRIQGYHLGKMRIPSWNNVAAIGAFQLTNLQEAAIIQNKKTWTPQNISTLSALKSRSEKAIIRLSDSLMEHANPGFKVVMGGNANDYSWGSNGIAANQAWLLMQAYQLTGHKKYRTACLDNLDYLLGRNPTGYCFVTGFGSLSPLHPFHRISMADKIELPIPGLMVGGPTLSSRNQRKGFLSDQLPVAYTDNEKSIAVNEVAIHWNAPLIYILAAIQEAL